MYYLIHTSSCTRPFLTVIAFIARDFRGWGYRVDCHPRESKYIAEIRIRERAMNGTKWRVELMEIWAREVISRTTQERESGDQVPTMRPTGEELSHEERRIERASNFVQDFVDGIAAFGDLLGLISKYMRLLHAVVHTSNATLPPWSNPDILIADKVTLEFHFHEALRKEHLVHAMSKAISKNIGRMGRVERVMMKGSIKVALFVDVSDCVIPQGGSDEEMRDPVPVYERGERPPPYLQG
ncbi:uncharacterized protein K460DRAFT_285718 [Cucurbitaria berberidis CBS 394.84]|uniref:Uncharacterized protein n=1 Tax=Cucurbitaria berberidis CBS 394.84 TaxID=1168544 RepID=A0A9P4GK26_9PLEO|nr:uncharacterized protein K460DRAFT_285718 [Cucurbitaria berberidis CBS 394.84]KAF1846826.1 hypothetical protein K460DRAFT_285718 [Cucurbitaria berberidis CBS 394.84]